MCRAQALAAPAQGGRQHWQAVRQGLPGTACVDIKRIVKAVVRASKSSQVLRSPMSLCERRAVLSDRTYHGSEMDVYRSMLDGMMVRELADRGPRRGSCLNMECTLWHRRCCAVGALAHALYRGVTAVGGQRCVKIGSAEAGSAASKGGKGKTAGPGAEHIAAGNSGSLTKLEGTMAAIADLHYVSMAVASAGHWDREAPECSAVPCSACRLRLRLHLLLLLLQQLLLRCRRRRNKLLHGNHHGQAAPRHDLGCTCSCCSLRASGGGCGRLQPRRMRLHRSQCLLLHRRLQHHRHGHHGNRAETGRGSGGYDACLRAGGAGGRTAARLCGCCRRLQHGLLLLVKEGHHGRQHGACSAQRVQAAERNRRNAGRRLWEWACSWRRQSGRGSTRLCMLPLGGRQDLARGFAPGLFIRHWPFAALLALHAATACKASSHRCLTPAASAARRAAHTGPRLRRSICYSRRRSGS